MATPHHPLRAPDADACTLHEWNRLVRLCGVLSGSADAAEDLAQETLVEAWRHADRQRHPEARRQWLNGIARNVCRRWRRQLGRDIDLRERATRDLARETDGLTGEVVFDLEREELGFLLEQAIGTLPASTREPLVQHLVEERPHAEIADRLGISTGAVAVRIHRGRQALRHALSQPDMREHAADLGIVVTVDAGWQQTRIWCPFCGRHRLDYHLDREANALAFRCAGWCFCDGTLMDVRGPSQRTASLTSPKAMLSREMPQLHAWYREVLEQRIGRCGQCGAGVPVQQWNGGQFPAAAAHPYGIQMMCPRCGLESGASLWHLLVDTPEAQAFWRRHPRMEALPVREIDAGGRPALLSGFACRATGARLEIISAVGTYALLHIERSGTS